MEHLLARLEERVRLELEKMSYVLVLDLLVRTHQ